jgi:hypothetical protein
MYAVLFLLLCGCSTKLEIISLSDKAFIEENLPISIDMKNGSYPFLNEAIKAELEKQIEKDGFTVDEKNASYHLDIELLSHDKLAYHRYEPVYSYSHIRCTPNGECYRFPIVRYIPCLDVSETIYVMLDVSNKNTNETKKFPLTSKNFANNCYYGFRLSNSFGSDTFLLDNVNKENIKLLAAKIKQSIFPIRTVQKENLSNKVKSMELSQSEIEIFKQSFKLTSKRDYNNAILGFESLKDTMGNETPYEIYLNLGLLYEYTGDLDKALQNYEYLPQKENYIKRIYVKKRYEKR